MPEPAHHHLRHHRHTRRKVGRGLSHLMPAVLLVTSTMRALAEHGPLGIARIIEFVVGAAYIGLLVRELRQLRAGAAHHGRVAWLEVAAAGILALEGYHIWHRHHEAQLHGAPERFHLLPWLYWGLALVYLALAFGLISISRRQYLRLEPDGFSGRLRPFGRAFSLRWAELAEVVPVGAADLRVRLKNGRERRLSLTHLHEGARYRDEVVAHARQAGVGAVKE